MESFEYEQTRTGVRYSAPEGLHDDCVVALALAVQKGRTFVEPFVFFVDQVRREPDFVNESPHEYFARKRLDPEWGWETTVWDHGRIYRR